MTEEEKNKEKRKTIPLTKEEYLTFFFFPYTKTTLKSFTENFNKLEDERFEKHNFNTKSKQTQQARRLGLLFYAILIFIAMTLLNYYKII
ncbi:hypothetical protein [Dokdonia sp.]|uniref:hypothetical protein n=1 Tax=Dokdonia sp. TaxID=2024995 RepID=UPI003264972C